MLLTPHIVRTHELTVEDLSSIFIGTQQNVGLGGPPPLIAPAAGGNAPRRPPAAAPTAPTGPPGAPVPVARYVDGATGFLTSAGRDAIQHPSAVHAGAWRRRHPPVSERRPAALSHRAAPTRASERNAARTCRVRRLRPAPPRPR